MNVPMHLQLSQVSEHTWQFRTTFKRLDFWTIRPGYDPSPIKYLLVASMDLIAQFEHDNAIRTQEERLATYMFIHDAEDLKKQSKHVKMWIDYHGDYDAVATAITIFDTQLRR